MKKLVFLTIIVVVIPVFFFSLFGCMKTPEHKADYGPEFTTAAVNGALNALGQPDPLSIKKGEFSYTVFNQSVDTGMPQIVMQAGTTVTNRTEDPDSVFLTLVAEKNELIDGSFKTSKEESRVVASKHPSPSQVLSLSSALTSFSATGSAGSPKRFFIPMVSSVSSFAESKPRVTFHKLSQEKTEFPIPDLVKARPDCGGYKTENGVCSGYIKAMMVTFDRITWESEERGSKTHFRIIASPDVPYFSNDLQFCRQDWIDYQGRVVPVNLCKEVKDFKFGTE